ncbi:MAG: hypothetical protein GY948_15555, partial [Alphaproteobacteria bacterium]|nr:hypothetical protein [Alphaproteobacteria bacterium]
LPEVVRHDWVDRIFRFTMRSSYMDWTLSRGWDEPRARDEDARTILRMYAKIRWRVSGRIFQLWRAPAHDDRITVDLGLPRDPRPTQQYGSWHEVEALPATPAAPASSLSDEVQPNRIPRCQYRQAKLPAAATTATTATAGRPAAGGGKSGGRTCRCRQRCGEARVDVVGHFSKCITDIVAIK